MWFLAWSQIVDAYSNLGLTMALYACPFTFTKLIFKFLRRKPNDWFDFLEKELICWFHLRLFWILASQTIEKRKAH